jgi:hypothetical protein
MTALDQRDINQRPAEESICRDSGLWVGNSTWLAKKEAGAEQSYQDGGRIGLGRGELRDVLHAESLAISWAVIGCPSALIWRHRL